MRFHPEILEQLDEVASFGTLAVGRGVPRSAVIRAAVNAWLKTLESTDPTQIVAMTRASRSARRRKSR